MIVEAQSEPASSAGYWQASIKLSRHLEEAWAADLSRLRKIELLFEPDQDAWFAAMHGAVIWPVSEPTFKVYLNPAAHGAALAPHVTESALSAMGLSEGWASIKAQLEHGGILQCLALDLVSDVSARVKVYVRFHAPTLAGLSRTLAIVDPELANHLNSFAAAVFGAGVTQLPRPALVAYTLREGSPRPARVICQFASYPFAGTDAEISGRLATFITGNGRDARPYQRAMAAMNAGFDQNDKGIQNYLSLQRDDAGLRVTVYLCPRVYLQRYGPIGYDPLVAWPSPVCQQL